MNSLKAGSKIEHIPYNLNFKAKFNDSSILISIMSWDYLNLSLANEYVGDKISTQSKYQPRLSRIIRSFVPGGSANHIALFTSN